MPRASGSGSAFVAKSTSAAAFPWIRWRTAPPTSQVSSGRPASIAARTAGTDAALDSSPMALGRGAVVHAGHPRGETAGDLVIDRAERRCKLLGEHALSAVGPDQH